MLFELPEVLLVEILTLAGLQSAGCVLSSKKLERCHASSLDDLLWSTLVLKRWAISALPATGNWSWRSFATFLETEVRGLLRRSVKLAVTKLREVGALDEGDWHATARALLLWLPLRERRRIAAFVCADWQEPSTLKTFLAPISLGGSTSLVPLASLRDLLLQFPFLPIDAGDGADRAIGAFSRKWATETPGVLAIEGVDGPKHARDLCYCLTYACIMLNTDLHNPAVVLKIKRDEFVANTLRCGPLRGLDGLPDLLGEVYDDVLAHPLQIAPNMATVDSIVRSVDGGEVDEAAQYSIYSSLRPPSPVIGGGGATVGGRTVPEQIDWTVVYWNLVDIKNDLTRGARRAAWRHRWALGAAAAAGIAYAVSRPWIELT